MLTGRVIQYAPAIAGLVPFCALVGSRMHIGALKELAQNGDRCERCSFCPWRTAPVPALSGDTHGPLGRSLAAATSKKRCRQECRPGRQKCLWHHRINDFSGNSGDIEACKRVTSNRFGISHGAAPLTGRGGRRSGQVRDRLTARRWRAPRLPLRTPSGPRVGPDRGGFARGA